MANLGSDPKGLTFEPAWRWVSDYHEEFESFLPGLGVWNCSGDPMNQPAELKETALYLTATSTSTELGEGTYIPEPSVAATTRAQSSRLSLSPSVSAAEASPANHPHPSEDATVRMSIGVNIGLSYPTHVATPLAKTTDGSKAISEFASEAFSSLDSTLLHSSPSPTSTASQIIPVPTEDVSTASGSIATEPSQSPIRATQRQGTVGSSTTNLPTFLLASSDAQGSSKTAAISTTESINSHINAAPIMLGSHTISTNDNSQYILSSQTLIPGSPITLGSGASATPVILHTSNSQTLLVVGSSTSTLLARPITTPGLPALSIDTKAFTANSENQYIIESQTLALNLPITLGSGTATTPVLLQTTNTDTILVIGSSTSTLAAAATAAATPPPFTIGSQVITANSENQYIVASQTLTPGALITVSGTPVSLAPSATQVVVGSSTQGLGGQIMSGFNGANPSASGTGVMPFTGAAERRWEIRWWLAVFVMGAISLMAWL